jgi:hypothetical protein
LVLPKIGSRRRRLKIEWQVNL